MGDTLAHLKELIEWVLLPSFSPVPSPDSIYPFPTAMTPEKHGINAGQCIRSLIRPAVAHVG